MATAAVVLTFGSALAFACLRGPATDPPDPPVPHTAVTERTPPLCQLVKRPGAPDHGPKLHRL